MLEIVSEDDENETITTNAQVHEVDFDDPDPENEITVQNDHNHFLLEARNSKRSLSQRDNFEVSIARMMEETTILNTSERRQLENLIMEFKDVFSNKPGTIKNYEYNII